MKNCKEIAELIDQRDFDKLSFSQKFRLRIHFLRCEGCKKYNVFSKKLSDLLVQTKGKPQQLTPTEKNRLKDAVGTKRSS